jgi:F0F1-type ATP synthase assembly protein I
VTGSGPEPPSGGGPDRSPSPSGAELAGLGVFLTAVIVLPLLGGIRLDDALNSGPAGLLGGLLLGIVAASAAVFVRFRRYW